MPNRLATIIALLLAGLAAACASPSASETDAEVDLEFGIHRLQNEAPFVVNAGTGQVIIRGYFRTPCAPYDATAEADLAAGTLTVRLEGQQPSGCRDVIGNYGYQATVRGVPAGEYQLRVVHANPSTAWPVETVVDMQVVVQ